MVNKLCRVRFKIISGRFFSNFVSKFSTLNLLACSSHCPFNAEREAEEL